MYAREYRRDQAVTRHRVKNARLPVQQHEHHGRQSCDCPDLHEHREPRQADLIHGLRDRRRIVQIRVRHDTDEHGRREDIEDGADDQRPENTDRHVLARVSRFGAGSRHGLEPDVGEKDRGGRGDDAGHPVPPRVLSRKHSPERRADFAPDARARPRRRRRLRRRHQRGPQSRVHVEGADHDKSDDHRELDRDDDVVYERRFGNADYEQGRDRGDPNERRQIDDADAHLRTAHEVHDCGAGRPS